MFVTAHLINDSINTIQDGNKKVIDILVQDKTIAKTLTNMVDAQTEFATQTLENVADLTNYMTKELSKPNNSYDPMTAYTKAAKTVAGAMSDMVKPQSTK